MSNAMKIRAKATGGVAEVKAIVNHPMETGQRKDPQTGQTIPAHYITKVEAKVHGKTVLVARWGGGISKNPFLSFKVGGVQPGDRVVMSWEDNRGQSGTSEAVIQ